MVDLDSSSLNKRKLKAGDLLLLCYFPVKLFFPASHGGEGRVGQARKITNLEERMVVVLIMGGFF